MIISSNLDLLRGTLAKPLIDPEFYFQQRAISKLNAVNYPVPPASGPEFCKEISARFSRIFPGLEYKGGCSQTEFGLQYWHVINESDGIFIDGSHEQEIWNCRLKKLGIDAGPLENVGDLVTAIDLLDIEDFTDPRLDCPPQWLHRPGDTIHDIFATVRKRMDLAEIQHSMKSLDLPALKKQIHPWILRVEPMAASRFFGAQDEYHSVRSPGFSARYSRGPLSGMARAFPLSDISTDEICTDPDYVVENIKCAPGEPVIALTKNQKITCVIQGLERLSSSSGRINAVLIPESSLVGCFPPAM